jgi:ribose transport system permease protein
MGVLLAFIILCVFLSVATDNFLTTENILVVLRQAVWVGIIAIGMTYVISTSGIDLSVGSIVGFCGLVTAVLIKGGMNIYLALLIAVAVGTMFGFINGLIIAKVKVNPFIATMAMMSILRGLIYVYTQGIPIYGLSFPEFQFLAQGYVGGIPFPIVLLVVLLAIFWYILKFTKFGRYVLSVGSNEEAAKLVGINIERVKIGVYVITGLLSAVSGILLTSRSEAAVVDAGNGYELDVIAAVIIGGTSLSGGKSNLLGAILGSILMVTIRNGLNLLKISSLWHQVVIGAVILVAVVADIISNRTRKE